MYSPQICDELIPRIYEAAKEAGIAMTTWVNQVVERALSENGKAETKEIPERRNDSHDQRRA